jgi:hypothetical protein
VDLIDREADLLNRARAAGALAGLRARIASLFLNFIETPEFNPEASRHQVVPKVRTRVWLAPICSTNKVGGVPIPRACACGEAQLVHHCQC